MPRSRGIQGLMTPSCEAFEADRRGSLQQTSIAHRDQQYTSVDPFQIDFNPKRRRPPVRQDT